VLLSFYLLRFSKVTKRGGDDIFFNNDII